MDCIQFLPIDLNKDFQRCVDFLCDTFVCSYGNADEFENAGGAEAYWSFLEDMISTFPEGNVHVWHQNQIVGQIEMRLRQDLEVGIVNLFYLVPQKRGGHLGVELQSYSIDVLRKHGVERARLSVSPSNTRAISYYTKHGWRDLGRRPDRPYVHAMEYTIVRDTETKLT